MDRAAGRRIVPRQPIYLRVFHAADEDYFVRAFTKAWRRFPLEVRRSIVRDIPETGLQVDVVTSLGEICQGRFAGQTSIFNAEMQFCGKAVDFYPEQTLIDQIAFQLARVFDNGRRTLKHRFFEAEANTEARVTVLVASWGFPPRVHSLTHEDRDRVFQNFDSPTASASCVPTVAAASPSRRLAVYAGG